MLGLLQIKNIAVIERAEIAFQPGFNVLTGETGAGKSIVIDAISAILGQRVYRDTIRTGSDQAKISAVFQNIPEYPWFKENGIPYSEELLIQREIHIDGKNLCRVNGQPVTVTMLRGLGEQLIQIHGQHDSAQLFDEANHLTMLDAFAGHDDLLSTYRQAYFDMDEIRKQIRNMTMDESEKLRKIETLKFQIQEIERAELHLGEDEELEKQRTWMRNGEKLLTALSEATEALYGGEESDGAATLTAQAAKMLCSISNVSEDTEKVYKLVEDLSYSLQDAAEQVRDLRDNLDFSPDRLEAVEARLDVIHRLKRKYGTNCKEILDYMNECKKELETIEMSNDTILKLQKVLKEKKKIVKKLADQLTESRKQAATSFAQRLIEELRQLDMRRVEFKCELTPLAHLDETGGDNCRFLMSANIGEELRQMSRIASGGELARIMLAIKNVMSEKDHVPTMIFDEVDTGVSGRAAQKVAEKLHKVSIGRQVLCVTHLPQIAAIADAHFLISKDEQHGRTYTSITPLDFNGRKEEIARLIGGAKITENTLKSAEEMLQQVDCS